MTHVLKADCDALQDHQWVAYDEAGLFLSLHRSEEEAEGAVVLYARTLEPDYTGYPKHPVIRCAFMYHNNRQRWIVCNQDEGAHSGVARFIHTHELRRMPGEWEDFDGG